MQELVTDTSEPRKRPSLALNRAGTARKSAEHLLRARMRPTPNASVNRGTHGPNQKKQMKS
jgi:hypothetical protein